LKENTALRAFAKAEETEGMTEAAANDFLHEFSEMWPGQEFVTTDYIIRIKKQLVEQGIHLEYRFIRAVVVEACYQMNRMQATPDLDQQIVRDAIAAAERILGGSKLAPLLSAADENATIALICSKLKEIQAAGNSMEESIKGAMGDSAFDASIHDIWAHYAGAADTDTARAAFMQATKVLVTALRQKERGIKGLVDDLVAVVEKLNLG
jgi:hypothetical protein